MNTTEQRPPATREQVRDGWDRIAAGFDAHMTPPHIAFCDEVLERVGLQNGARFLDVACGTGALAIPAARRGARVTAIDLSPAMIGRLVARANDEGLADVDGRVMDGHDLEFADDTFDVAASQHGVSLLVDIDRGLRELVRVTKPGGRVLIIAFGPPRHAEFLMFFLAALRATVPGFSGLPMDPPPLPFQVADPAVLTRKLTAAGVGRVDVETTRLDMHFRSASHLWDAVTSSNPVGAEFAAGLTGEQVAEAGRVLDGMLRERSDGRPEAVLHATLNIAVGEV